MATNMSSQNTDKTIAINHVANKFLKGNPKNKDQYDVEHLEQIGKRKK